MGERQHIVFDKVPDLMTRGDLYEIIRMTIKDSGIPNTYENALFRQLLVEKMNELSPRWPDGQVRGDRLRLNTDMVSKKEMTDAMNQSAVADGHAVIVQMIVDEMEKC